jgi:hypothetical protein
MAFASPRGFEGELKLKTWVTASAASGDFSKIFNITFAADSGVCCRSGFDQLHQHDSCRSNVLVMLATAIDKLLSLSRAPTGSQTMDRWSFEMLKVPSFFL